MPDERSRISAREYAERAGLDYGRVRHLAEEGKIPGATKNDRGHWRLPEPLPSSDVERLTGRGGALIAGFGKRDRSDWTDLEALVTSARGRFTGPTLRAWARDHPEIVAKIRSARQVVYRTPKAVRVTEKDRKKKRKSRYIRVAGPLGNIAPGRAGDRLLGRYGIGFPA